MKDAEIKTENSDAEYRLEEALYILHQADIRSVNSLLKKRKKDRNESSTLPASQHRGSG